MIDVRDALLFLDLDKGGEAPGPLFEEPRRRLQSDPRLRAAWSQYQALRALGWECAPEPGEKLTRQALLNCRRERVKGQLARSTGSDDLAREILLGRVKERRGLPGWALALLLAGALGLGWLAFGRAFMDFQGQAMAPVPAATPLPEGPADEPLPFEFSAQTTPAEAALASPISGTPTDKADDMRGEDAASRQARKLLRDHLRGQEARAAGPKLKPTALPTAQPKAAPTALPTAVPTAVPTTVPTAMPTAVPPTVAASPLTPAGSSAPLQAGLKLSAESLALGGTLQVTVDMPERREVDLRLFDMKGRPVRELAEGFYGPGQAVFTFDANDDAGQALKPATYYLRVMTPWFSRVEPIEIR